MRIKIKLDKGQSPEDADNELFKAMSLHANGDAHESEFDDPVMQEYIEDLTRKFSMMLERAMDDIHAKLDSEHGNDYF